MQNSISLHPDETTPLLAGGEREREFLEQSYWRLGSVALAWSTVTMVCVLRRRVLDIPIFGPVQPIEAIIFTQSAFCFLLPLLLVVVAIFRGATVRYAWNTRVPGVLADVANVPAAFGWLRVVAFVSLVMLPTAAMCFCYGRTVQNLSMHPVGAASPQLKGEIMFHFPPKDAQHQEYDWRWAGEDIELPKGEKTACLTAITFWQPWAFRLTSYSSGAAALWFLFFPAGTLRAIPNRCRIRWQARRHLDSADV